MRKFQDLSGQTFGRLTALKRVENNKQGGSVYLVRCNCQNKTIKKVAASNLKKGHTKSCGCLVKENKGNNKTHGSSNTRLYKLWINMKARCDNPNSTSYINYGYRGIGYAKEWRKFEPFKEWALKNGYKDNLSLERINVNGHYEPLNCKWIPLLEQAKNKRNNIKITYRGETKNLVDWYKFFKISETTITRWYKNGTIEKEFDNLSKGLKRKSSEVFITYNGERKSTVEWKKHFNIGSTTLNEWKRKGILEEKFDYLSQGGKLQNKKPILITYKGETKNLAQWSERFNTSSSKIRRWHEKGVIEEEFNDLLKGKNKKESEVLITYKGETKNLTQWAKHFNTTKLALYSWRKKGILEKKFDFLTNGGILNEPTLFTYKGKTKSLPQWAKHFNVSRVTTYKWRKEGILKEKFDFLTNGGEIKGQNLVTYNGTKKSLTRWAEHFNVSIELMSTWKKKGIIQKKLDELSNEK